MEPINAQNVVLSYFQQDDGGLRMMMASDGEVTAFSGVATNSFLTFQESHIDKVKDFLVRAVNNRTRERNFFKLYNELLERRITDDEVDKTIEDHEDDFVVSQDQNADLNDLRLALFLAADIKDVEDADDVAALFSFSHESLRKCLNP